ncbi:MAG: peptidase M15A [Parvibaculum sp.]|nr:peptidase M15A [Parvibaculum sp.]
MKLSKNLSLRECLRSDTAKRLGVTNQPHEDWVIENLRAVAEHVFQPVRDGIGVPVFVSSGYRSPELNKAIGGSVRSQHMEGRALDLDADVLGGTSNCDIFHYIKNNLEFDQLIWEFGDEDNPDWVHVSYIYGGNNRGRCLKAKRDDKGKTFYEVIFD